jgi:Putative auto-transporter adhesin, head GIN domain
VLLFHLKSFKHMKTTIAFFVLVATTFSFICTPVHSQKGPLRGSGKVIEQTYSFTNFDQINLQDLDGNVEIEVGKPYSVAIAIDDNLVRLLRVEYSEKSKLSVYLEGNRNNRLYIENTQIKVRICLPSLSYVVHSGNDNLTVTGIQGEHFKLNASGNGKVMLNGTVGELEIVRSSNAHIHADKLFAKTAYVKSLGNGNAVINVSKSFVGIGAGNSSIINVGTGAKSLGSGISGNGRIVSKN